MKIIERIESALEKAKENIFEKHMPPKDSDIDVVLVDAMLKLKDMQKQIAELHVSRESLLEYKNKVESEDYVLVNKNNLETWYFDEYEGLWLDRDGIDGGLSQINIGEVVEIKKQKQYNFEYPNTFVALPWVDGEVSYWEEYATKEEAEEVAKHCKAMFDSQ